MSSNILFEAEVGTIHQPSELEEKKSVLRAMILKRDNLAMEIGYRVKDTISSYPKWIMDQVNFDDPRLSDIKDKFFSIEEKIHDLHWEVDRLEAIENNDLPRHEAKVKVYSFFKKMSGEDVITFLQSYHLSTITLTEAVLLCPTLLDDMTLFEENLEIIRSRKEVWW